MSDDMRRDVFQLEARVEELRGQQTRRRWLARLSIFGGIVFIGIAVWELTLELSLLAVMVVLFSAFCGIVITGLGMWVLKLANTVESDLHDAEVGIKKMWQMLDE